MLFEEKRVTSTGEERDGSRILTAAVDTAAQHLNDPPGGGRCACPSLRPSVSASVGRSCERFNWRRDGRHAARWRRRLCRTPSSSLSFRVRLIRGRYVTSKGGRSNGERLLNDVVYKFCPGLDKTCTKVCGRRPRPVSVAVWPSYPLTNSTKRVTIR